MQQLGLSSLIGSLKMYNGLVERCFKDCVDSFRRKDLEGSEEKVPLPGAASPTQLHKRCPAAPRRRSRIMQSSRGKVQSDPMEACLGVHRHQ